MKNKTELNWLLEFDKNIFIQTGINSFDAVWNIETSTAPLEYKHMTRNAGSNPQKDRLMTCVKISDIRFYIRRASGPNLKKLAKECRILQEMPRFGLTVPRLAASAIDAERSRGILVYKNLAGFYSLSRLMKGEAPPDVLAEFQVKKKKIVVALLRIFITIRNSRMYYFGWDPGHVMIRPATMEISIVDLSEFHMPQEIPVLWKIFPLSGIMKLIEWRKFRKTLKSKVYSGKYLTRLLKEGLSG